MGVEVGEALGSQPGDEVRAERLVEPEEVPPGDLLLLGELLGHHLIAQEPRAHGKGPRELLGGIGPGEGEREELFEEGLQLLDLLQRGRRASLVATNGRASRALVTSSPWRYRRNSKKLVRIRLGNVPR